MVEALYPAAWLILQGGADVLALLENTGILARVVLLILLLFSIASLGVILSKTLLIKRIRRESETFWRIFEKARSLGEISSACETLRFTPLAPVFDAGYELIEPRTDGAAPVTETSGSALERKLHRAAVAQLTVLESHMTFLATTASVTPFIGLFGTVWGVIGAFVGLTNTSVTTLSAVGGGIAEALIATAAGLFAAIPAVMAYNYFVGEIRGMGVELDDLQAELLAIAEKRQRG